MDCTPGTCTLVFSLIESAIVFSDLTRVSFDDGRNMHNVARDAEQKTCSTSERYCLPKSLRFYFFVPIQATIGAPGLTRESVQKAPFFLT